MHNQPKPTKIKAAKAGPPHNALAYSVADAVRATSVGRTSLYAEIKAGKLKTFKIGRRTLIAAGDLSAWLAAYQEAA